MRFCVSLDSYPAQGRSLEFRYSVYRDISKGPIGGQAMMCFLTIICFAMVLRGFSFRVTSFLFLSDIPVLYLRLRWGFVGLSRRDIFTLVASGDISPSRVSPDFSGTCRLFCRNKGALFCHCRVLSFYIDFLRLRHPLFGLPAFPLYKWFFEVCPLL
jgi:hypothetical protein